MAVLHKGKEASVGALSYEVVRVAPLLEEGFDDWVEAGLHHALETDEHLVESDEADAAHGRPERLSQLNERADQALQLVDRGQDEALVVFASSSNDIASLELCEPVLAVDALPFCNAFLEFFIGLIQRLQLFKGNIVYFAGLRQQGRVSRLVLATSRLAADWEAIFGREAGYSPGSIAQFFSSLDRVYQMRLLVVM